MEGMSKENDAVAELDSLSSLVDVIVNISISMLTFETMLTLSTMLTIYSLRLVVVS